MTDTCAKNNLGIQSHVRLGRCAKTIPQLARPVYGLQYGFSSTTMSVTTTKSSPHWAATCSAHTIDLSEDRMLMRTIAKNGVGGKALASSWSGF